MSKKLTKRDVDSFSYKGGWDVRWDNAIPGFGVRIYPSGKKAYVLSYRQSNRKRLMVLGQTSKIALDMARDLALQSLGAVASKADPLNERRKKSAGRTVEKVFDEFLERYAKPKNRSWKEVKRSFDADVIPVIGQRPVHEITKQDILKIIDAVADRGSPVMANRMLAHLRKFFRWCHERSLIDSTPVINISKPSTEISRDRVLTDSEIKELWASSDKESYPFGHFIQLALLTAQRRQEILTMRWQDINFEEKLWCIPKENTKSNRRHNIPLSERALEILESVEKCGSYIFTIDGIKPFNGVSKAKARLDNLINEHRKNDNAEPISEWRIHDLRRTAASGMARMGVAPHVVEKILNHSSGTISGVSAVYNRYEYANETRIALSLWAEYVHKILFISSTSTSQ